MSRAPSLSFYREVLRAVRQLPTDTQSYYRAVAREKFVAHRDETDPARVQHIVQRSRADVAWILTHRRGEKKSKKEKEEDGEEAAIANHPPGAAR